MCKWSSPTVCEYNLSQRKKIIFTKLSLQLFVALAINLVFCSCKREPLCPRLAGHRAVLIINYKYKYDRHQFGVLFLHKLTPLPTTSRSSGSSYYKLKVQVLVLYHNKIPYQSRQHWSLCVELERTKEPESCRVLLQWMNICCVHSFVKFANSVKNINITFRRIAKRHCFSTY